MKLVFIVTTQIIPRNLKEMKHLRTASVEGSKCAKQKVALKLYTTHWSAEKR